MVLAHVNLHDDSACFVHGRQVTLPGLTAEWTTIETHHDNQGVSVFQGQGQAVWQGQCCGQGGCGGGLWLRLRLRYGGPAPQAGTCQYQQAATVHQIEFHLYVLLKTLVDSSTKCADYKLKEAEMCKHSISFELPIPRSTDELQPPRQATPDTPPRRGIE